MTVRQLADRGRQNVCHCWLAAGREPVLHGANTADEPQRGTPEMAPYVLTPTIEMRAPGR